MGLYSDQSHRRWLMLFAAARTAATAMAVVLLLFGELRGNDAKLLLAALVFGVGSLVVLLRWPALRRTPGVWAVENTTLLVCIALSGDWRSPFYLLWLTTLAVPAVHLTLWRAALLAVAGTAAYVAIALLGGPVPGRFAVQSSETLAIHFALPGLLVMGIAYAADVLRRLQAERVRSERLAVETERRRIAWELHDSAKQRVHAAHLLVSALQGRTPPEVAAVVEQSLAELQSAVSDMDTSLSEMHSPLEGRPLVEALRRRADELSVGGEVSIEVRGDDAPLPPLAAAHAYRIGSEAMTNAVRHSEASRIRTTVEIAGSRLRLRVTDDGIGMPTSIRDGALGLMAMRSRATSLGGEVRAQSRPDDPGTEVELLIPLRPDELTRTEAVS